MILSPSTYVSGDPFRIRPVLARERNRSARTRRELLKRRSNPFTEPRIFGTESMKTVDRIQINSDFSDAVEHAKIHGFLRALRKFLR